MSKAKFVNNHDYISVRAELDSGVKVTMTWNRHGVKLSARGRLTDDDRRNLSPLLRVLEVPSRLHNMDGCIKAWASHVHTLVEDSPDVPSLASKIITASSSFLVH